VNLWRFCKWSTESGFPFLRHLIPQSWLCDKIRPFRQTSYNFRQAVTLSINPEPCTLQSVHAPSEYCTKSDKLLVVIGESHIYGGWRVISIAYYEKCDFIWNQVNDHSMTEITIEANSEVFIVCPQSTTIPGLKEWVKSGLSNRKIWTNTAQMRRLILIQVRGKFAGFHHHNNITHKWTSTTFAPILLECSTCTVREVRNAHKMENRDKRIVHNLLFRKDSVFYT